MRTIAVAAWFLLATGCAGSSPGPSPAPNGSRANVMETLNVGVPSGSVTPFLSAIEQEPIFAGDAVGLQAEPGYPQRLRAQVATGSYIDALDDARAKALAIATHLGAHLGMPRSVDEVSRSYDGFATQASGVSMGTKSMVMAPRSVSGDPNGLTTLAVSFSSDRGDISVFGSHTTTQSPASVQTANGAAITLTARGKDLSEASGRLKDLDAAVRRIAAKFGAGVDRITVQNANINTY